MNDSREINPEEWVSEHGDILYRYALGRMRDPVAAEDIVQETFLAAMKSKERFSGKSSERTWLIGILKHKMIDHFRKSVRQSSLEDANIPESQIDDLFQTNGMWKQSPADWQVNPRNAFEQKEFWEVLDKCLGGLQKRLRDVFTLRELEGKDADEICNEMGITATNLWVMLYRSRMRLRGCLEENWINKHKQAQGEN